MNRANIPEKPTLLLVDGHSLAFRSFYAFSKGGEGGLSTKEGIPTSVTYGFLKSLLDICKLIKPQGLTIAFDTAEPTFRHLADPNYKANRDVAPDIFFQDLDQLEIILRNDLNLSICKVPGFEADDILGTLAKKNSDEGWKVRVLTGDRDLFQLVDDKNDIAVMYMGGGPYSRSGSPLLINESKVNEKLGVSPEKVVDFKALTGDSSDNIPGVKGVGPKTAINLLRENINLDGIYSTLENLEKSGDTATKGAIKGAVKSKLLKDKDNAYLSKMLASIKLNVPINKDLNIKLKSINSQSLRESLEKLELNSLVKQISLFEIAFTEGGYESKIKSIDKVVNSESISISKVPPSNHAPLLEPKIINSKSKLDYLINILMDQKNINFPTSLDTETTGLNPFKAELVGIGICWGENIDEMAYIPVGHKNNLEDEDLEQLPLEDVLEKITPWIESYDHPKALQNAKFDRLILLRHGINLKGLSVDTLLADYLRNPIEKHSLDEICFREFNYYPKSFSETLGKNKTFAEVSIKEASKYCGMDVFLTRKLSILLKDKLKEMGEDILNLFNKIEIPLEEVLANMESNGIKIDISYLKELSENFNETLNNLEKIIYSEAGLKFNIKSPKQLAEILFEQLKLDRKKSRKTKTGYSTDATVLEKLSNDHPIINNLIEHRTISKLLSTYVEALPELVESETQRVHTDFNQAVTATGRLSSSNPNLQNIPMRTEFSRRIRKAFLPKDGWKLLSADYSQIELRILAHLSGEDILIDAYKNQEDVHSLTAKLLLEKEIITPEERRLGKTINFGVIYGMGFQRFARSAGVSKDEAKVFLKKFKDRYKKVFKFLELQEKLALSRGYVSTILGRRRYFNFDKNGLGRLFGKDLDDIDLNFARRAGIEAQQLRAAANAPIQGSSSDIIKTAMINLNKKIKDDCLQANLLLQVHDELVLEVDPSSLKKVNDIVKETMENAIKLTVPLLVETGSGLNWMDCK